ncbi:thiamine pyrophosphate-dependent enzyme [Desulfobaculum bizertense]|uniref:2-oxoglutarate ferredoxin oxidoreductase subunit beta n=1 Tax=Desulfobaculum bizertense DSM 18034 TaxID=1121442 RepID=A0A1T4X296_9BACT|nr:thiamine pyrophosphate-dependent enzyme [Desulfobaculum bizertense]UIJ37374.1 thiamine pyrophosphate-dependent enzyme [Desulfobaculum bizertense]SKA83557.1 2-oxoglutarate ferredoxin oxidoreductase subunit beta [Desulfobaculum bizertense DSM 18034]
MDSQEKVVFSPSKVLVDRPTHYCPGCQHGTTHRIVAECLEEMGLAENAICIASIGCSVFIYNYLNVDSVEAPHGRAPAVATGAKRARPDKFVFAYQGDGDLASIGLAEIMHAANRGEKLSIIFVNNTVYGMTGGQMAPTTMVGQRTTTSPRGRNPENEGMPIRMTEIIAGLGGTAYAARVAVNNVANIAKAKRAVKKAFEVQQKGLGFGFVEFLSTCPTNWKMSPIEANKRIETEMIPYFPLGVYTDKTKA